MKGFEFHISGCRIKGIKARDIGLKRRFKRFPVLFPGKFNLKSHLSKPGFCKKNGGLTGNGIFYLWPALGVDSLPAKPVNSKNPSCTTGIYIFATFYKVAPYTIHYAYSTGKREFVSSFSDIKSPVNVISIIVNIRFNLEFFNVPVRWIIYGLIVMNLTVAIGIDVFNQQFALYRGVTKND
jgi:hypothetical protein